MFDQSFVFSHYLSSIKNDLSIKQEVHSFPQGMLCLQYLIGLSWQQFPSLQVEVNMYSEPFPRWIYLVLI